MPENERAPATMENVAYSDFVKMYSNAKVLVTHARSTFVHARNGAGFFFILWQLWGARFLGMCLRQLPDHYFLIKSFLQRTKT